MTTYQCLTCGSKFSYEPSSCPVCGSGRIGLSHEDMMKVMDTGEKIVKLMMVGVIFIIIVIILSLHFIFQLF